MSNPSTRETARGWRLRARWRNQRVERAWALALILATIALSVLAITESRWVPETTLLIPLVIGTFVLTSETLPMLGWLTCAGVVGSFASVPRPDTSDVIELGVHLVVVLVLIVTFLRRAKLGISAPRGESMFVDLRDRISRQGTLPPLGREWSVESAYRTAEGTAFAGDFVVASRHGSKLDLVVVDVSGKGVEAGSRSLFLSGAFNGILSSVPPGGFLPAANDYLIQQDWDEGFATAIHLHLDLKSGEFELRKAGHPPALWIHAGSGRWSVLGSEGPVLGLIPGAHFEPITGVLEPNDGLMLYTDGLVETPRRDLARGIDRLAGFGDRLVQRGFEGGADFLLRSIRADNDDVALVIVHRRTLPRLPRHSRSRGEALPESQEPSEGPGLERRSERHRHLAGS